MQWQSINRCSKDLSPSRNGQPRSVAANLPAICSLGRSSRRPTRERPTRDVRSRSAQPGIARPSRRTALRLGRFSPRSERDHSKFPEQAAKVDDRPIADYPFSAHCFSAHCFGLRANDSQSLGGTRGHLASAGRVPAARHNARTDRQSCGCYRFAFADLSALSCDGTHELAERLPVSTVFGFCATWPICVIDCSPHICGVPSI